MLLSARPQFRPSWAASPRARELRLAPLADAEIRGIITQLETAGPFLTEDETSRVAERSGGVPLFAIELTRLIVEQRATGGNRQIPASLSDLLTARLDQLGDAKGVAELAAVIGNEIPLAVLEAVSGASPASLHARLSMLKKHRVLHEQERTSERSYAFTHALLREAAYHAIPKGRRRDLHRRVASVIADKPGRPRRSGRSLSPITGRTPRTGTRPPPPGKTRATSPARATPSRRPNRPTRTRSTP